MRVRGRQGDLHAQLELRVRARQEGPQGQGRASRSARCRRSRAAARAACWAATARSMTAFTDNPKGCAAVARLLDLEGDDRPQRGDVLAAADDASALRRAGGQEDAAVLRGAAQRRSRRRRAATGLPRLLRRSRGRVYKNVNKALGGQKSPEDALKKRPGADREGAGQLLMAPLELLIAGAGSRGATYAGWAARHPERARVVAVAEPRDDLPRRARRRPRRSRPSGASADWREAAAAGRLADAAIVATLDREHVEPAIAFAEQGYALLLEKPLAPDRGGVPWRSSRRSSAPAWSPRSPTCCATRPTRGSLRRLLDERRGRRDRQRRAPRARRLLAPGALLRARQLAPRGRGRADAAGQVLPRPRLAVAT